MNFWLSYELDFNRIISAVINDSRSIIPATLNQPGSVVYAYTQGLINQVVPGVLVYRIVGDSGVLAGVVALQVENGVASVLFSQLRPAFLVFSGLISQIITNFITNNFFLQDMLY